MDAISRNLLAGVAKVVITDPEAGPANDPLYVKALVLSSGDEIAVIVTVDAVAIAEIGSIKNDFLANVRSQLNRELNLDSARILINASHCHGQVCADVEARTVQAVVEAWQNMVPVSVGAGTGCEDRIMENRRLVLKNGREADVRHAYSLPPDEEIASVGPVDSEIGILRLDREDGETLAVVFNFACHPILEVPSRENTADISGFASRVIEDNLSEDTIALFLQGCGGDVNPILYKDVNNPRDAEILGNMLGLSTLQGLKRIRSSEGGELKVIRETIELPRADLAGRIESLQAEQIQLLGALKGTSLNLKTFIPLYVKYNLARDFPSYYSHRYLHEEMMGRDGLKKLDAENRANMDRYIENIYAMEKLTRIQINLNLLKKHQARNVAAGESTIEVEMMGLRVGEFVLVTFPGELSVEIGLNIKKKSPHKFTFVAGVTNGYIYYTPTAEQLENRGGAQEDSDCMLAPEWQMIFEDKVGKILALL
ncbi:MAG: hypothetical protein F4Z86_11000 [Gemmatimonadetes bacterium]|nr:hypothetical protein [Gemmatimonadota bacterium]MYB55181.1 hypothetical protein [Gemmatimonadota bacterium]